MVLDELVFYPSCEQIRQFWYEKSTRARESVLILREQGRVDDGIDPGRWSKSAKIVEMTDDMTMGSRYFLSEF